MTSLDASWMATLEQWWMGATWRDGLEVLFVLMSVVGQHFIARRRLAGFYFWIIGSLAAMVVFTALERWPTVLLHAYFLLNCIYGVRAWRKLEARTLLVNDPVKVLP